MDRSEYTSDTTPNGFRPPLAAGAETQRPSLSETEWEKRLKAMSALKSREGFEEYCEEHQIPISERGEYITALWDYNVPASYYEELMGLAQVLDELEEKRLKLMKRHEERKYVHQPYIRSGVGISGAYGGLPVRPAKWKMASEQEPVRGFELTEEGHEIDPKEWETVVQRICQAELIDLEQKDELKVLMGLQDGENLLRRPILFKRKKSEAVLLFGLLYGTVRYHLKERQQLDQSVIESLQIEEGPLFFDAGYYSTAGLIKVKEGEGAKSDGTTRDPYWDLLGRVLQFKSKRSATVDPAHSFSNAMEQARNLPAKKALPVLAILRCLSLGDYLHYSSTKG